MTRDEVYQSHILEAAVKVEEYAPGARELGVALQTR